MKPETVLLVRRITTEIMRGLPDHHGVGHVRLVEEYSRYLALCEGGDHGLMAVAANVHDMRYWDEEERRARKISLSAVPPEGKRNTGNIMMGLLLLGEISAWEYKGIITAVRRHSRLPREDPTSSTILRCLRDADRLSRAGVTGLLSILEANQDYGVPIYVDGEEIVKPLDAPLVENKDILSCVSDINACLGWEEIMETPSGRNLMIGIDEVNRQFLRVFEEHRDMRDYLVWIGWLEEIKAGQVKGRRAVTGFLEEGRVDEYARGQLELENPELLSESGFREYLSRS